MTVSIASYAFHGLLERGMIDLFGYLESLRYRYHLETADIWNGMLASTEPDYVLKVKEALDNRGLGLANLCCDWCQCWDAEPEARERNKVNALAHLRAAAVLGASTVRIDFGGQDQGMTEEQFDWTVGCFTEYARFASDHGFMVGPENHYGPARVLANQFKVAEAVGSGAYGILLHFGNWVEDPDACDKAVAHMAMHTHIDAKHCDGDIGSVVELLTSAGYKGCYSVEHHSGRNEYAEVALQLAQLKRILPDKA